MTFTAKDVKELRDRTGCGMMDCKKALTASDGDMDRAVEFLREKGLAAAAKKSSRVAAEGTVRTYLDRENGIGVVIEINAETDFVGNNAEFLAFAEACARTVARENPRDTDALLACALDDGPDTVDAALKGKILTIGENIRIRRFARYEGAVAAYNHGNGRIGVLVRFDTDLPAGGGFDAFGLDVAMQIAAMNPPYLSPGQVPADVLEREKSILLAQIANDPKLCGKPDAIREKMVLGRLGKFYRENCLLQQAFVKNGDIDVARFVADTARELGGRIAVAEYVRFERGEGIEKQNADLASEVADLVKPAD